MFGIARNILAGLVDGWRRPDVDDPRVWGDFGAETASGVSVSRETLFQLPTSRDCIQTIAGSVGSVPFEVYEVDPRTGALEPYRDHHVAKLFRLGPNPEWTAAEWLTELATDLVTDNNGYAEIVPGDAGWASALIPIKADRVSGARRVPVDLLYDVSLDVQGGRTQIPRERLFHVRISPFDRDGVFGIPRWIHAREAIGRAVAVHLYGARFFRNGTSGGDVIEKEADLKGPEQDKAFLSRFERWRTGPNQHRPFMLARGMKIKRSEIKNNEAQFLETKKDADLDICRLFNVPPHKVGILDNAHLKNVENQSIQYVGETVVPYVVAIEGACGRDLIDDPERYIVRANLAMLLRGDLKSRYESYQIGLLSGFLTVNECRRAEGLNPIGPAGDVLLRPLNMDIVEGDALARALTSDDPAAAMRTLAAETSAKRIVATPIVSKGETS